MRLPAEGDTHVAGDQGNNDAVCLQQCPLPGAGKDSEFSCVHSDSSLPGMCNKCELRVFARKWLA